MKFRYLIFIVAFLLSPIIASESQNQKNIIIENKQNVQEEIQGTQGEIQTNQGKIQESQEVRLKRIESIVEQNQELMLHNKSLKEKEDGEEGFNFWRFLSTYNNYKLLIFIPAALLFISIFVFFVNPSISWGEGKSISFGLGRRTSKQRHAGCPLNTDFFHVLKTASDVTSEIMFLGHIEKISRQMNFTEEKLVELKTILTNNFSDLLLKTVDPQIVDCRQEIRSYAMLLDYFIFSEAKVFFRQAMKNNKFAHVSDIEFRSYVKDKAEGFVESEVQFMNIYYDNGKVVLPREKLKDSVYNLRSKFIDICFDIFTNAVQVTKDIEKEQNALQISLENYCTNIMGTSKEEDKKKKNKKEE